jgi:signal transduction histidine kinase
VKPTGRTGSGVGLSIAKSLMTAMSGELELASAVIPPPAA